MITKEDLWPGIKAHYDRVYPKETRAVHAVSGPPLTFVTTAPSTTTPIGFGAPWYGAATKTNSTENFIEEVREYMLVLYFNNAYLTWLSPEDYIHAIPGQRVSLVDYTGNKIIEIEASSYFSHARVICYLGQVIDSIAESHIDKK